MSFSLLTYIGLFCLLAFLAIRLYLFVMSRSNAFDSEFRKEYGPALRVLTCVSFWLMSFIFFAAAKIPDTALFGVFLSEKSMKFIAFGFLMAGNIAILVDAIGVRRNLEAFRN